MVQSKGKEHTLYKTINGDCQCCIFFGGKVREGVNETLHGRPDIAENNSQKDRGKRGGDGHKAFSGKKAEIGGHADTVIFIEKVCSQCPDDDSAKDTGVDRVDPHNLLGFNTVNLCHHSQGCDHHHIANNCRESGDPVIFTQSQCDTDSKEQRQVAENSTTGIFHQLIDNIRKDTEVGTTDTQ